MSLEGKAWEAFVKLWGDDEEKARQWLEANPQARNRAIEDEGLITRQETEFEIGDEVVTAITRSVLESDAVKSLQIKLAEAEAGVVARATEMNELNATIAKLVARLEVLERAEAVQQREIEDDTPAKLKAKTRLVYRPREANNGNQSTPDGNQVALATLDKIGLKY